MCPGVFREVPYDIVCQVIEKHRGIVEGTLPQNLTYDDLCDLIVQANEARW